MKIANRVTSAAAVITKGSLLLASPSKIGVRRVEVPKLEPIVAVSVEVG